MENGLQLNISKDVVDEFSLIGLNNIDFISTGFYRNIQIDEHQKDKPHTCNCEMHDKVYYGCRCGGNK